MINCGNCTVGTGQVRVAEVLSTTACGYRCDYCGAEVSNRFYYEENYSRTIPYPYDFDNDPFQKAYEAMGNLRITRRKTYVECYRDAGRVYKPASRRLIPRRINKTRRKQAQARAPPVAGLVTAIDLFPGARRVAFRSRRV